VRAQIFCVEKKTEGWVEKGWFRVGANNNPNTFFFVKEVKVIKREYLTHFSILGTL